VITKTDHTTNTIDTMVNQHEYFRSTRKDPWRVGFSCKAGAHEYVSCT